MTRSFRFAGQVGESAVCQYEELTAEKLFQFVYTNHAASLQRDLSTRVKCVDDSSFEPRYLCGMDAAYEGDSAFVAASVWDATNMEIIETATIVHRVSTKYVPGFLGFREGLILVTLAELIRDRPNAHLIHGKGV